MDWVTVRTHPGAERRAIRHLDRQQFSHFFPKYRETVVRRGRRADVEQFVFPSYGFVDTSSGSVRSLAGTRGVAELLGIESNIVCANISSYVKFLQASRDAAGFVVMPEAAVRRRRVGDRVRVERGPFESQTGVFDGQTSQQRVFVLLRIMGRGAVRVRLDEADLAA